MGEIGREKDTELVKRVKLGKIDFQNSKKKSIYKIVLLTNQMSFCK